MDEAGCTGRLPSAGSPIQPVLVVGGVIIPHDHLYPITQSFLDWKRRFYPRLVGEAKHDLDHIKTEIKGSELRKAIRKSGKKRKYALKVLSSLLDLLEAHDAKIIGRVWIKGIGEDFDGNAVYTSSMQSIFKTFNHACDKSGRNGFVIADSRSKPHNANVAHSIFTEKFRVQGDAHPHILEMPTFGHSENHAGLQIADMICSALLFPMATVTYCQGHLTNDMHVHPTFDHLKKHLGSRLKDLQYRYQDSDGRWRGGITVADAISKRSGVGLFRP